MDNIISDLIIAQFETLKKEIKSDIRTIKETVDIFNEKIVDYKVKPIHCREQFDKRYFKIIDKENIHTILTSFYDDRYILKKNFKNHFQDTLNKCKQDSLNNLNNKTYLIKNILNIVQALAPYILFLSYLYFK